MTRSCTHVLVVVGLSIAGCTWPFKQKQERQPYVSGTPEASSPPLLIGPDAAGHVAPTELPPKEASVACLAAARELDKNGKVREAIMLYERARQQDPSLSAELSRRLAVLYDLSGDFEKSSAEYDKLLLDNPKDAKLRNDIGYSYYCRGDLVQAESHLKEATNLDPSMKRAWLNLGLVLAAGGKAEAGLNAFARAGSEAEARSNLGFVLMTRGKYEEAKEQYRRAIELEPGLTQAQAALERLENPNSAADRKRDPSTVQAGDRRQKPAMAEDVPTIYELEERLKLEDEVKQR